MATMGIPQHPLYPREKRPLLPEWQQKATTNVAQIKQWSEEFPSCNFGSVAKGGFFVFEADSTDVRKRFENTGNKFSAQLIISSSPGRGHRWYRFMDGVENIGQSNTLYGDFSLRVMNEFCVSAGSVHPSGGQYRVIATGVPDVPSEAEISFWLSEKKQKHEVSGDDNKLPIPSGQRNDALTKIAGRDRANGLEEAEILAHLLRENDERCVPPLPKQEVETIAHSVSRYENGVDKKLRETVILNGTPVNGFGQAPNVLPETTKVESLQAVEKPEDKIPPFDPSVINGIYADFVELVTRGTTMQPQFAFGIAKAIVGAKMAGKVTFENLDVEPRLYLAMIGETGSGKGEAWRRSMQIIQAEGLVTNNGLKIINSADSGAGIRDAFLEPPADLPIICYVDEITSLGNKAAGTRNPAILDTMIELADSTSMSRVLAKKKGDRNSGLNNRIDARFCMVMCGQDGSTYMQAFAGRTKLGLYDRLYPEFGVAVEAGDLPPVDRADAFKLLAKLNSLNYSGTMTMLTDAKALLDTFWLEQPTEVRKKARWKKNLMLDAYMSAFGRSSMVAEAQDVEIAIKIFTRQLVIRQVCFAEEVPDRVGYYLGLIKKITEAMEQHLAAGLPPSAVAKSRRDYEKATHAHRDNETHIFDKAWRVHAPVWLRKVQVKKDNGQLYEKFLPAEE
jgi:Bifunctional DNA primase/polymerase, N-terminal/Primase C terminal 1 (PriCT-1)